MDSESNENRSEGFIDIVNRIRTAVAELAEKLRPHLRAKAGQWVGATTGAVDASDVTQDAAFAICRKIGSFRSSTEAEFLAWANTVLRNKITDELGGRDLRVQAFPTDSDGEVPIATESKSPSSKAVAHEDEERARAALAQLKPDEQEIIRLRYFQGKEWEDIEQQLHAGVVALKGRYYRAIRHWKEMIGAKT